MSTDRDSRSWFVRFCDTFFQEQNIKYMLGVGMLILLGSSLMLVTSNWESYTPAWKYLILIAYTAAIHGAGQVTYHNLGLRKTGTGLMSLTVLLLPLSFLAVRWIDSSERFTLAGLTRHAALAALLGVNVVFTALAARRIFRHFLRRTQPTFLISYLVLCLAGAVVLVIPVEFAPWTTLALWCVFAAGSIKVNRHVFWLTEERRLPRIYGFFPILLLGGMFLTLFTFNLAGHVPLTWIGFGCVLVAIPVLLAADAVADVFQKRGYLGGDDPPLCRERTPCRSANGESGSECDSADGEKITECNASERHGVRSLQDAGRLPWSVALPMWIGLALTATGVCLSAAGFPETYGLAPTAVLAATMLALTARRTGRSAFVWVMLIGVLIAYQASPVFFRELARTVVHQGAVAVNESKLPYAFYGLTYLPLLAGTALISVWRERRRDRLFAQPLRYFTVGLSLLLLAVSLTHVKAIFPSGAALTLGFLAQTLLFRDRRLLVPAAIAWTTTTLGSAAFLEGVLELSISAGDELLVWTGSAALLFAVGRWLDRSTLRFSSDESQLGALSRETRFFEKTEFLTRGAPLVQMASFGLLLVPTVGWLAQSVFSPGGSAPWLPATVIGLMLLVHAVRWRRIGVVDLALAFPVVATALIANSNGFDFSQVAGLVTVLASLLWTCGCYLRSARAMDGLPTRPTLELRAAFGGAASRVSTVGLGLLLVGYLLPLCGLWMLSADSSPWFRLPGGPVTWIPIGLIVLWSFDAARRQWAGWVIPGWIAAMSFSGAVAIEQGAGQTWLPAVWAGLTLLAVPKVGRRSRIVAEVAETSGDSSADARSLRDFGYDGRRHANVARLLSYCTFFTFSLIALSSLLFFSTEFRVAGAVSLCGLLCLAAMLQQRILRTLALMLVNWQVLCVVVQAFRPEVSVLFSLGWDAFYYCALPVALVAALQALAWERADRGDSGVLRDLINFHSIVLQLVACFSLLLTLPMSEDGLTIHQVSLAVLSFAALAGLRVTDAFRTIAGGEQLRLAAPADSREFRRIREIAEVHVWCAIIIAAAGAAYLWLFGEVTLDGSELLFGLLAAGIVASLISSWSLRSPRTAILAGPLRKTALWLPGMTVIAGVTRHFVVTDPEWLGLNSLALLLAAGFYFWRGLEQKKKSLVVLSAGIVNVALALLWQERNWSDPQFYMIPLGATLLALVELLKPEIPKSAHDPLRYVGALTILVSPTFNIVGGSWLHLLSLMVASVLITLVAMGLRVRALMYMGTGFLVADIIAMVVRGSIDRPSILWIAGILVGASVITLAAWCERHREQLLQRLRLLSAELQTWE